LQLSAYSHGLAVINAALAKSFLTFVLKPLATVASNQIISTKRNGCVVGPDGQQRFGRRSW
jgi:hypothetical protein